MGGMESNSLNKKLVSRNAVNDESEQIQIMRQQKLHEKIWKTINEVLYKTKETFFP